LKAYFTKERSHPIHIYSTTENLYTTESVLSFESPKPRLANSCSKKNAPPTS
jgi:hypothetical protein